MCPGCPHLQMYQCAQSVPTCTCAIVPGVSPPADVPVCSGCPHLHMCQCARGVPTCTCASVPGVSPPAHVPVCPGCPHLHMCQAARGVPTCNVPGCPGCPHLHMCQCARGVPTCTCASVRVSTCTVPGVSPPADEPMCPGCSHLQMSQCARGVPTCRCASVPGVSPPAYLPVCPGCPHLQMSHVPGVFPPADVPVCLGCPHLQMSQCARVSPLAHVPVDQRTGPGLGVPRLAVGPAESAGGQSRDHLVLPPPLCPPPSQHGEDTFNRAKLLNVGFLEALKEDPAYDCFIFSDVDLVPMDDRNLYRCGEQPRHFAIAMDKFGFRLPYAGYFGGVSGLSKAQFLKINGFPNEYWGWGGEDDDIFNRISLSGMKVSRPDIRIGRYRMIKHDRDKHNEPNPQSTHPGNTDWQAAAGALHLDERRPGSMWLFLWGQPGSLWRDFRLQGFVGRHPGGHPPRWGLARAGFTKIQNTKLTMKRDGIGSVHYRVLEVSRQPLFTNITVDIGRAPPRPARG
ncbi:beta-1,4-galactosyltransferase 2 [Sarcophilus harrisii]|uniref:beta-1,4-galactosyltransferase 2 n=1 Tax=Sarcophilus harrisii TaxID=9305 RepID=UPI001301AF33|nr:beta-1,4-galactosyltransferase 2 [Sarcophilus harrisii]